MKSILLKKTTFQQRNFSYLCFFNVFNKNSSPINRVCFLALSAFSLFSPLHSTFYAFSDGSIVIMRGRYWQAFQQSVVGGARQVTTLLVRSMVQVILLLGTFAKCLITRNRCKGEQKLNTVLGMQQPEESVSTNATFRCEYSQDQLTIQ